MKARHRLCLIVVVGVIVSPLVAGCSKHESRPVVGKPDSSVDRDSKSSLEKRRELPAKISSVGSRVDGEIAALLDGLLVAVKEEDPEALGALTSPRRMFQEIERQQLFFDVPPAEKTALRIAFTAWLGDGLLDEALSSGWKSLDIQRVAVDDSGKEAQAITRISVRGNTPRVAMRFWLTKTNHGWKVFDWDNADSFLRASSHIGAMLAVLRVDSEMETFQRLLYAARLVADGNYAEAQSVLDQSRDAPLPDFLEAGRWLLYAQTKFAEDDPKTAKRCLEAAATLNPSILAISKLRSACNAALGDYASSLEDAKQALTELGGDTEIYTRMGDALAELGQPGKAADAYRKGLDLDSDSVVCLLGLSVVLPAEKKNEIGKRFAEFSDPTAYFEEVIQALLNLDDVESAEAVLDHFKEHSADQQLISYYEAEIAVAQDNLDDATDRLQNLVSSATNPQVKSFFESRLIEALVAAGKPVDAYMAGTDKQATFAYIADRLMDEESADSLLAVATEHENDHPEDIRVYLFKGIAHYFNEEFAEAEKELAKGMSLAETESIRDRFRQFRVLARFKMGEGLSAYEEIPPRSKTFEQLADLFLAEKQGNELEKLVALHRQSSPSEVMLDVWEAEAKLLTNDYKGAAACIETAMENAASDDVRRVLRDKLLDVHLTAKTPLDAYQQAEDSGFAFRYLADRLLADGDGENLEKLVQAHRDRLAAADIVEGANDDIRLEYYEGRAKLLMEDLTSAAETLARGLENAESGGQREAFREQLVLAHIKQGEGLNAYEDAKAKFATYDQLAQHYAREEDADKLEALIDLHAKNSPNEPTLALWKAEVHWLRQEYEKVADVLLSNRTSILSDPLNRGRFEDRLIRSLLRAKRGKDARREAKLSTSRDGDPWFEAVVAAATDNLAEATAALRACVERGYTAEDFYADDDLGAALRSQQLDSIRNEFPEPDADLDTVDVDSKSAQGR